MAYPFKSGVPPVPPELKRALGARVKDCLDARGLTLTWLAGASGISTPMLSRLAHGRAAPSLVTLLRLAEALGVSTDWLLTGEGPHGGTEAADRCVGGSGPTG